MIFIVIAFGVSFNNRTLAQITSNATASAVIIQQISLSNVRDLSFGNISASASPGTVVLTPSEAATRIVTGGVTLPSGSGTVKSAKFVASGADGYSFSIMLPTVPITLSNGTSFMTIDNFTSVPSGSATFTPGAITICVGATLNVNANQEAGVYISTQDFEVTVSYN